VHRSYPATDRTRNDVLVDVSMTIAHGTVALVRGPSGAGKTTLLNLLATIDRPDRGRVLVHGRDVAAMGGDEISLLRRRDIGVVYQDAALIERFPVWQNVSVGLVPDGMSARQRREHAARALESVRLLPKLDARSSHLSGGEQQRVAIARAIVHSPSILVADEPTSQVDAETTALIIATISALRREGMAIVVASHASDWREVADVVWNVHEGRLVEERPGGGASC
jgi:putative ABC transport system ATP-binding protein